MQLAMIGLGRMGGNMAARLIAAGHQCVVLDRDPARVDELTRAGGVPAHSLGDLASMLQPPRTAWLMLPAGPSTEQAVADVAAVFQSGDAIVDGGNTHFKDDVRRARQLAGRGIDYVDVGTSGGVWGRERGYCLMIGGPDPAVSRLQTVFATLAPGEQAAPLTPNRSSRGTAALGYLHCGPAGAGHFVKMIHNGIEYGLMQAYAEGFDIMRNADSSALPDAHRYELPVGDIAELWRRGSVIGSWLLDLTAMAFTEDPRLDRYSGHVDDSGEGRWALIAAIEEAVPAHVLSAALYARFRSRQSHTFAEKVLSAMREKFGGHRETPPT